MLIVSLDFLTASCVLKTKLKALLTEEDPFDFPSQILSQGLFYDMKYDLT